MLVTSAEGLGSRHDGDKVQYRSETSGIWACNLHDENMLEMGPGRTRPIEERIYPSPPKF